MSEEEETERESQDELDERLPFDVELERIPTWVQVSSGLVIVASVLVATRLVPMFTLLPFLIVSSLGRRFSTTAVHVEVHRDGFDIGERTIPRADLVDVWVDGPKREPRAVVALGADQPTLAVLHFENAAQAERFGEALGAMLPYGHAAVLGHRPRPIDLLASLRFVGIAAAFFGTGSSYGLFALVFFALGAWPVVRAKQLIVTGHGFEVRSLLGVESFGYDDVQSIDSDAGVIALKEARNGGAAEISLPRAALRDPTLVSAEWLERTRMRALDELRRRRAAHTA